MPTQEDAILPNYTHKMQSCGRPGETYGFITIGNEETGELVLYSIYGKEEGRFKLEKGTNRIPFGSLRLTSGIYLYRVWADDEIKNKDKIVKVN